MVKWNTWKFEGKNFVPSNLELIGFQILWFGKKCLKNQRILLRHEHKDNFKFKKWAENKLFHFKNRIEILVLKSIFEHQFFLLQISSGKEVIIFAVPFWLQTKIDIRYEDFQSQLCTKNCLFWINEVMPYPWLWNHKGF